MESNLERVMRLIDELSEPEQMSKQSALNFYEEIMSELDIRAMALRDELETDE